MMSRVLNPVGKWLSDLRLMTETECMSILQGKSILSHKTVPHTMHILKDEIDKIKEQANIISLEFCKLFKRIEKKQWQHLGYSSLQLTCRIRALVSASDSFTTEPPPFVVEQKEVVMGECAKLAQQTHNFHQNLCTLDGLLIPMVNQLTYLGQSFSRLVDLLLGHLVQCIVEYLEECDLAENLNMAISTLVSLGLDGEHMCYIIAREGGLRSLFDICRSPGLISSHCCALRAVATVCCVTESIVELERQWEAIFHVGGHMISFGKQMASLPAVIHSLTGPALSYMIHLSSSWEKNTSHSLPGINALKYQSTKGQDNVKPALDKVDVGFIIGGVECIIEILCDNNSTEELLGEAAGVIAQITSPCLNNNYVIPGFLDNMEDLIKALTVLCERSTCKDVMLLSTAALANLSFMENIICEVLLHCGAPRVLIQISIQPKTTSMFTKDQVATILANMAAIEICRGDIVRHQGIELLLDFLKEGPSKNRRDAAIAACERVQQKAAIALTRLSQEYDNACLIVQRKGMVRLVELCRDINERHNSDAVLVACLAALRKICSLCGVGDLSLIDVQQLVQPRLVDSFLICTQQDENFV